MIIKCPECGHQVSDKAPSCPTCGVQIAGRVCQCQNCGEVYFSDLELCPACHQMNRTPQSQYRPQSAAQTTGPAQPARPAQPGVHPGQPGVHPGQPMAGDDPNASQPGMPKKKSNKATIIVAFIFAAIICGGLFYLYQKNSSDNEQEEYEYAMHSNDEEILKQYLEQFPDAPLEHIDSIKAHLERMSQGDIDWQNAVLSNSRNALQQYLDKNPNSPHRQEALNKIDSLDWLYASKDNNIDEIKKYLADHPDGFYVDDANEALDNLKSTTLQADERQLVTGAVRRFFQSINSKDEAGMTNAVSATMDEFLGKMGATADDVRSFLQKNYKDGVTNINWHIDASSYDIKKRQVADDDYAYDATVKASRDTEMGANKTTDNYTVTVTIDNTGKISSMNIKRR